MGLLRYTGPLKSDHFSLSPAIFRGRRLPPADGGGPIRDPCPGGGGALASFCGLHQVRNPALLRGRGARALCPAHWHSRKRLLECRLRGERQKTSCAPRWRLHILKNATPDNRTIASVQEPILESSTEVLRVHQLHGSQLRN